MDEDDIFNQGPIDLSITLAEFDERLARGLSGARATYDELVRGGVAHSRAVLDTGEQTLFCLIMALSRLPLTSQQMGFAHHCLLAVETALEGGRRGPLTFPEAKAGRSGKGINAWERMGRLMIAKAVAMVRTNRDLTAKAASKIVADMFNATSERQNDRKLSATLVRKWSDDADNEDDRPFIFEAEMAGRSMTVAECDKEVFRVAIRTVGII